MDDQCDLSLKDLQEGFFYVQTYKAEYHPENLRMDENGQSNACLYIIKDGKLCLHKESFWEENDATNEN